MYKWFPNSKLCTSLPTKYCHGQSNCSYIYFLLLVTSNKKKYIYEPCVTVVQSLINAFKLQVFFPQFALKQIYYFIISSKALRTQKWYYSVIFLKKYCYENIEYINVQWLEFGSGNMKWIFKNVFIYRILNIKFLL